MHAWGSDPPVSVLGESFLLGHQFVSVSCRSLPPHMGMPSIVRLACDSRGSKVWALTS